MDKRTYSTEAIVLARKNYGEADRILVVFSKHYGKLRLVAKGVRKTTSRKRGNLEIFNHIRLLVASGKSMDILADVELKNSFSKWRKDLTKIAVAYHLAEVVGRLTPEKQEHETVFNYLANALVDLSNINYWQLYDFIQSFKVHILEELGFLERGKPIPGNLDYYIEDLINGQLKTKKFLSSFGK